MGDVTPFPGAGAVPFTAPAPISSTHDLSRFDCGNEALNDWLRRKSQSSEGRTARTFVVCTGNLVVGYYCLSTGSEKRESTPKRLQRNAPDNVPLLLLGRLAVDKAYQGHKIGSGLLKDALRRALSVSNLVGARALMVHAIDNNAMTFYLKYGFVEFPNGSQTLFLPIESITAAL